MLLAGLTGLVTPGLAQSSSPTDQAPSAQPDGIVAVIHPQNAVAQGDAVVMHPQDGRYVFQVSLFDGNGTPLAPERFVYGLYAPDASGRNASAFDPADPYWSDFTIVERVGSGPSDTNVVTVSLSAADVGFGTALPLNAVAFFFTLRATNVTSYTASTVPTSHYNLAANHAAEVGDWQDADVLGQTSFTGLLLITPDGNGLAEPNQPVLNPDFALGAPAAVPYGTLGALAPFPSPAPAAAPPWDLELGGKASSNVTQSTTEHSLAGDGSALVLHVDPADLADGSNLQLVQNVGELQGRLGNADGQGFPLNWTNPQTMTARVRLVGSGSDAVHLALGISFVPHGSTYSNHETAWEDFHVSAADGWVNLTMPVASHCFHQLASANNCTADQAIDQVFLEILGSTSGQTFDLQVDSVRVNGAQSHPVTTQNDLNDGYATYIHPLGVLNDAPGTSAVADSPLATPSGSQYLFEVQVWNTVKNAPVPASDLLATSRDFKVGQQDPANGVVLSTGDADTYALADGSGVLVAVPADQVPNGTTSDAWFWAGLGPAYQDTFVNQVNQASSQRASGYYSVLKNALQGFQAADALDYAVTPLTFTGQAQGTYAYPVHVQNLHLGASSTSFTLASDSPALEPLTVTLSNASTGTTVTSAPVGLGHPVQVTIPQRLPASWITVDDGRFTSGTQLPVGVPSVSVKTPVENATTGVLDDSQPADLYAGTWLDPCITGGTWTIRPAGSAAKTVIPITASGNETCLSADDAHATYQFPTSGAWTVTLTVQDAMGKTASDTAGVTVANAAPAWDATGVHLALQGCGSAPVVSCGAGSWTVDAGRQITFESDAHDPSVNGHLVGVLNITSATTVGVPDPSNPGQYVAGSYAADVPFTGNLARLSLPSPGTYDVRVTWSDGTSTLQSLGTIVAQAPDAQAITVSATPTVGGKRAGPLPALAGENVTVRALLLLRGDGLGPNARLDVTNATGSLVASATSRTVRVLETGTQLVELRATVPAADLQAGGSYNLLLNGTTYEGTDLASLAPPVPFDVVADHAPNASLSTSVPPADDGRVYLDPGQPLTLSVASTDADCAGSGPRCQANVTWNLGDGAVAYGPTVTVSQPHHTSQAGTTVTATITDDAGMHVTKTITYVVDDQLTMADLQVPGTPVSDGDGGQMYAISSEVVRFKGFYIAGQVMDLNGTGRVSDISYVVNWSPAPVAAHAGASAPAPATKPLSGTYHTGDAGSFALYLDTRTGSLVTKPGLYIVDLTIVPTGTDPVVTPHETANPATADTLHTTIEIWVGPWPQAIFQQA